MTFAHFGSSTSLAFKGIKNHSIARLLRARPLRVVVVIQQIKNCTYIVFELHVTDDRLSSNTHPCNIVAVSIFPVTSRRSVWAQSFRTQMID